MSRAVLLAVFQTCFPAVEKAQKSTIELERELQGLRLETDKLGEMDIYGGQEVWLHIAFAERALDLAKHAKIDGSTSSIWAVC